MITSMILPMITNLIADAVGDGSSSCNVYPFSNADADYFEIEPYTGNFKIILAATSETGIAAEILPGKQGVFTPSIDPVNDPKWVQYEVDGSIPAIILEATFTGVIGGYAKDDVWYSVNMGSPKARYAPMFDGVSGYVELDSQVALVGDFSASIDLADAYHATWGCVMSGVNFRLLVNSSGSVVFGYINDSGANYNFYTTNLFISEESDAIRLSRLGDTLSISLDSTGLHYDAELIDTAAMYVKAVGMNVSALGGDDFMPAVMFNLKLNDEEWRFDEPFSEYPVLTSSLGNTATAYNFTSDDVVEILE